MTYEQFMLSLCLWREARGQSSACMAGIAAVIHNRSADPKRRWRTNVVAVILQPFQFSSFNAGDPNSTRFPTPPVQGGSVGVNTPDWNAWIQACDVATTPLTADPTHGATNYESLPPDAPKPAWADEENLTTTIGPFRFYKL